MILTMGGPSGEDALGDGEEQSDEQLMAELRSGSQDALRELHRRYAPLVFHIACRSLDAPAAEEITQDAFLRVWQKAASFDPARGSFRSWILQIAHHRVLNELRQRGRRPRIAGSAEATPLELAAQDPGPEEEVWAEYRRSVIDRALAALPREQGRALRLAFFQDLTHAEVADFLKVPLGTAKGRIRMALEKLNARLVALVAALLAAVGISSYQWQVHRAAQKRDERALAMLTSSRMEALRLVPPSAVDAIESGPHANYRAERGGSVAVFTLSHVPPPPPGEAYWLWSFSQGQWKALGMLLPDAEGRGRLLIESQDLTWPESLKLTHEPTGTHPTAPKDPAFLAWGAKP